MNGVFAHRCCLLLWLAVPACLDPVGYTPYDDADGADAGGAQDTALDFPTDRGSDTPSDDVVSDAPGDVPTDASSDARDGAVDDVVEDGASDAPPSDATDGPLEEVPDTGADPADVTGDTAADAVGDTAADTAGDTGTDTAGDTAGDTGTPPDIPIDTGPDEDDGVGPSVVDVDPPTGSLIHATQAIVIEYDEAANPSSAVIAGDMADEDDLEWSAGDTILTITPSDDWADSDDQSLTVDVDDPFGNAATTLNLSYDIDALPPYVSELVPPTSLVLLPPQPITVEFSEPVDPGTFVVGGDILPSGGGAKGIPLNVSWSPDDSMVTLEPIPSWSGGDDRTLTIAVDDVAGNPVLGDPYEAVYDVHFRRVVDDGEGNIVGVEASLAISDDGHTIYIAYADDTDKDVLFVRSENDGLTWSTPATIHGDFESPPHLSMAAVDDTIFVAFEGFFASGTSKLDLLFRRSDDGGDTWENVQAILEGSQDADFHNPGPANDIAVLGNDVFVSFGNPRGGSGGPFHEAYVAASDDSGANWPAEEDLEIPGCFNLAFAASSAIALAEDSEENLWVYFVGWNLDQDGTYEGDLHLARSDDGGASWDCIAVHDPAGGADPDVGSHVSLAVHGSGSNTHTLHIAYFDQTTGDEHLRYARSDTNGTTWEEPLGILTDVDDTSGVGTYPSLAVSEDGGTVYISYHDVPNGALKFARSSDGGDSWYITTVDTGGSNFVGEFTSIAVAGVGATATVVIAYFDKTNDDLLFTRSDDNGQTW